MVGAPGHGTKAASRSWGYLFSQSTVCRKPLQCQGHIRSFLFPSHCQELDSDPHLLLPSKTFALSYPYPCMMAHPCNLSNQEAETSTSLCILAWSTQWGSVLKETPLAALNAIWTRTTCYWQANMDTPNGLPPPPTSCLIHAMVSTGPPTVPLQL